MCVFGFGREQKREEKRVVMGLLHGDMSYLHGEPRNNGEVASKSQLLLPWWAWAENGEGRKENLGLECLSPFYG